jgi:hypothetical protein
MRPPFGETGCGSGETTLETGKQIEIAAETAERTLAEAPQLGGGVDAVGVVEKAIVRGAQGRVEPERRDDDEGREKQREKLLTWSRTADGHGDLLSL